MSSMSLRCSVDAVLPLMLPMLTLPVRVLMLRLMLVLMQMLVLCLMVPVLLQMLMRGLVRTLFVLRWRQLRLHQMVDRQPILVLQRLTEQIFFPFLLLLSLSC